MASRSLSADPPTEKLLRSGAVFEVLIAVAIIAVLVAAAMIPAMTLLWSGVIVGSIGAVFGLLAGLVYHARLWQALRAESVEPTDMWLRPYLLHDKLSAARRGGVQAWFLIGAAGFGLTMLGATGILTAIVRLAAN